MSTIDDLKDKVQSLTDQLSVARKSLNEALIAESGWKVGDLCRLTPNFFKTTSYGKCVSVRIIDGEAVPVFAARLKRGGWHSTHTFFAGIWWGEKLEHITEAELPEVTK